MRRMVERMRQKMDEYGHGCLCGVHAGMSAVETAHGNMGLAALLGVAALVYLGMAVIGRAP